MKRSILVATNPQKALEYILEYPVRDFTETEIRRALKISRSGINYALRSLSAANFVFRNRRGKLCFYSLNYKNPVVRQLKVIKTILQLENFLQRLKDVSSKIILFGSSCRGENTPDSDIDLFIVSHNRESVEEVIKKSKSKRKIQVAVRSSVKFNDMKQTEPDFYAQVTKGIVLWEAEE